MKVIDLKQFEALGLSSNLLRSLKTLGYETPTPIQSEAIPIILDGHDLMGLAQTGTGKTAAFGLPLAQLLLADKSKPGPRAIGALILAPTRELVSQIADSLRGFVRNTPLGIRCVVGGASINAQIRDLQRGTDILVATPGRLLDLVERGAVQLNTARYLVLDEADQMLDLGFIHALRQIAKLVGTPRQTLLFSATMPKQIESLSRTYLNDPVRVQVSPPGRAADKIRQSVHFVPQEGKAELLKALLAKRESDLSLVFARTKRGAEKLMKQLVQSGYDAASIHGNKSQSQRDRAIRAFRSGDIRVLVATDVAARGIDIPGVSHVYNYDLPDVAESYVHRIGRTARAGANGEAVAFCSTAEKSSLRAIEKLMGVAISVAGPSEARSDEQTAVERPMRRRESQPRHGSSSREGRAPAQTGGVKYGEFMGREDGRQESRDTSGKNGPDQREQQPRRKKRKQKTGAFSTFGAKADHRDRGKGDDKHNANGSNAKGNSGRGPDRRRAETGGETGAGTGFRTGAEKRRRRRRHRVAA